MSSVAAICLPFGAPITHAATAPAEDRVTLNPESPYPEGPLVEGPVLYYAEMGSDRVMRWDGDKSSAVWSRKGCGPTSVSRAGNDALNILCHAEQVVVRISTSGATLKIIDKDSAGKPFRTPNASINDAKGGVYFSSSGTFGPGTKSEGAVLYLDGQDQLRRVAEGIHYSNGVALTPDGKKLYVSEHLSRHVLVYDVADDGSLSGGKPFVALDDLVGTKPGRSWEVGPDGLAVDHRGNLYIAEYGGGQFMVVDPNGRLLSKVTVPDQYITGLALAPGEARIFVTAPANRSYPLKGDVYSIANPVFHQD
jgi:gluconolactonase